MMAKVNITYLGESDGHHIKIVYGNGDTTYLLHRIVLHSPTGFSWGYGGSGPADLALNMLYDYFLRTKRHRAKGDALALHQTFKWAFIATAGDTLEITGEQIEQWLNSDAIQTEIKRIKGENL